MMRRQIVAVVAVVGAIEVMLAYLYYWRIEPVQLFRATSLAVGSRFVEGLLIGACMRRQAWGAGVVYAVIAGCVGALAAGVMHCLAWVHGLTSDMADVSGAASVACLGLVLGVPIVMVGFVSSRALLGLSNR